MSIPALETISRSPSLIKNLDGRCLKAMKTHPKGVIRFWWAEIAIPAMSIFILPFVFVYLSTHYGVEVGVWSAIFFMLLWALYIIWAVERSTSAAWLGELTFRITKILNWSQSKLEEIQTLNESEMQYLMDRLMIEVCEPVFDLQERSVNANPLEWRQQHAKLMKAVNERFDTLKFFGYMPSDGYGTFFRQIQSQRDTAS